MDVLMPGTQFDPQGALAKGLIDEVVPTREELVPAAKAWILAHQDDEDAARNPWDRAGYKMPGGTPRTRHSRSSCRPSRRCCASRPRARLPRAARDHERRGRGRAGRLRHRLAHREPLLHQPGGQPAGQEHDPGVLLRPPGDQLRIAPPAGRRALAGHQGRRARRRDDGRRHRLLLRPRRHAGRAQGRLRRGGREGQGVHRQAQRQGRRARQDHAGQGRRAARPHHRHRRRPRTSPGATSSSRPSSRTRRSRRRSSPR